MDEELKQLALLALKNAFFQDFSSLVNEYLRMAAELDVASLEEEMASISVYGRSDDIIYIASEIIAEGGSLSGFKSKAEYQTLVGALKSKYAHRIFIGKRLVFERYPSEIGMMDKWMFVYRK